MCGIELLISRRSASGGADIAAAAGSVSPAVARRGPDLQRSATVPLPQGSLLDSQRVVIALGSAVLHLRGDALAPQPVPIATAPSTGLGTLHAAWNGELFAYPAHPLDDRYRPAASDTDLVMSMIQEHLNTVIRARQEEADDEVERTKDSASMVRDVAAALRAVLEPLCGPFALVVVAPSLHMAFACRDPLGRRSLVVHHDEAGLIDCVASVVTDSAGAASAGDVAGWSELPIDGVMSIPLGMAAGSDGVNGAVECVAPWTVRHVMHPLVKPHVSVTGASIPPSSLFDTGSAASEESLVESCVAATVRAFTVIAQRSLPAPPAAEIATCVSSLTAVLRAASYAPSSATIDAHLAHACRYLGALAASVWRRCRVATLGPHHDDAHGQRSGAAPLMVLFSGGIDSTMLAALAHAVSPPHLAIDLVNVAFGDAAAAPDRQSCLVALGELLAIAPERDWRLVFVDVSGEQLAAEMPRVNACVAPCRTVMDSNIGCALWFAVRGEGTLVPRAAVYAAQGHHTRLVRLGRARRAVGNTVQEAVAAGEGTSAAATHQEVEGQPEDDPFGPLVDQLVTEGGQPQPGALLSDLGKEYAETVAELLARTGVRRLKDALELPAARARLRVCKATHAVSDTERAAGNKAPRSVTVHRVQLVRPDDIARAEAAKASREAFGKLAVATVEGGTPYRSRARVVLMGMGADESLGGYVRHAKHFAISGASGLLHELSRDFERLWQRNLGRDDRVAADHGREGRFPFLDEDVLHILSSIPDPTATVCDMNRPAGVGDKMILRTAARMVGLTSIAALVKRAVQFGTRIADRKTRGETPAEVAGERVVSASLRV